MSFNRVAAIAALLILLGLTACSKRQQPVTPQELDVHTDNVTLHARIAGSAEAGDVLIALHGGPGMSSGYMRSLEALAGPDLAVVTYDQRGAGRSASPREEPSSYTLDKYVSDLDAVREAAGAEQVHLLGHCWGGVVALRYASVHPERVRSIVIAAAAPPSAEAVAKGQEHRRERIAALIQRGDMSPDISSLDDLMPAYLADPGFERPEEMRNMDYNPMVERLTAEALGDYDLTDEFARIAHPVLFLWGTEDPFGRSMAEATVQALSSAQLAFVEVEKCGHFWQECPGAFLDRARAFLEKGAAP